MQDSSANKVKKIKELLPTAVSGAIFNPIPTSIDFSTATFTDEISKLKIKYDNPLDFVTKLARPASELLPVYEFFIANAQR